MEAQARPQDLLLAYDPDFVGYTSLSEMAQPLEQAGGLAAPLGAASLATGALGGTADPDGYYADFTARLDRFVRDHPRLGAAAGGGGGRPPDWKALVVTLDGAGYDELLGDDYDGFGDDYDGFGGDGGFGGVGGAADAAADPSGGEDYGGGAGADAESSPLISLQDFIIEVDGGHPAPGEMDESAVEARPYGKFKLAVRAEAAPSAKQGSLLEYMVDK